MWNVAMRTVYILMQLFILVNIIKSVKQKRDVVIKIKKDKDIF